MTRTRTTGWAMATLALLLSTGCGSSSDNAGTGGASGAVPEARSSLAHDDNPAVDAADYQQAIDGNSAFAFALLAQLTASDDGNLVMSPLSVSTALAMTYAGARGDTATQMAGALHFDLSADKLHPALNKLSMQIADENVPEHHTEEGDKSVRLALVNATWAQKDYQFVPAYLDTLAVNYGAGVRLMNFEQDPSGCRDVINQWVADQTQNKIQNLLTPDAIDASTRLVLTNALYFYGSWALPFDRQNTADGTFHTLAAGDVTASFMHRTDYYKYAEGDGYQVVDLPYDGNQLAMRVVLPAAGRFAQVRSTLSTSWLAGVDAAMASFSGEVSVALPKFKFDYGSKSLKPALQALHMTDAFALPPADFSGMDASKQLYVSDVLHKAFIGVDEDGTEAAAATAVIMNFGGIPDQPKDFSVDRPFLFMIRDTSGTLLFVGQVTNPGA